MKRTTSASGVASAIGPFSLAVSAAGFIFLSGQIGLNATGELVSGGVRAETEQTLRNIEAVLRAAGAPLGSVAKMTVYLADINDFEAMNEVYRKYFPDSPPARTTIALSLVRGAKVEMDAIAVASES